MRKLLFVLILLVAIITAKAQIGSIDLGIGVGGSFYWGDMTSNDLTKSIKPVYNGFFRYNFNPRYGIRVGGGLGTVAGDGQFEENSWIFEKKFWEINAMFEFFFLEYYVGKDKFPFSPYIMGGIGMMGSSYDAEIAANAGIPVDAESDAGAYYSENFTSLTFPFGLGVSFYLFPKFSLAVEANFRKTTKDGFDDLINPHGFVANDNLHNNDWVNFIGVTLNYKLFHPKRPCPVYDN